MSTLQFSRREFLGASAIGIAGFTSLRADYPRTAPPARSRPATKKLAVVTTAYHYLSHAYHVCGRFLNGYLTKEGYHYPDYEIAGMYVAQQKANDLSRELSQKHGFKLFDEPAKALTLGGDKLAVDGVLLIAEHGDYPYNKRLQKLYPRYELFQKVIDVFKKSGKTVPTFIDKHLSYDRNKAVEMVATAKKLDVPLFAGSSLPITWRRPELELSPGGKIERGLVATRGEIEIFGFHGLEALQCMMERRAGGETGVRKVRCLQGNAAWDLIDNDRRWKELLEAALSRSPSRNNGDIKENCRQFDPPPGRQTFLKGPIAFQIEYADATPALVLIVNGHVDDTTFAGTANGKIESTLFYLPPPPGAAFLEALAIRIEEFLASGRPPYPVERTLLTSAVLDAALESRVNGGKEIDLTDIQVKYRPPKDSGFMRGDYAR